MKAYVIKRISAQERWRGMASIPGDAAVYRLEPPMGCGYDDDSDTPETADFVFVSSARSLFDGPETYIFRADSQGEIQSGLELPGSRRGNVTPDALMRECGYEVIEQETEQER